MLRITRLARRSKHDNTRYRQNPQHYQYREINRWRRESMGHTSRYEDAPSHRPKPLEYRFNPEFVGLTKGTNKNAYKWWWFQQPFLPPQPHAGYDAPTPTGRVAWPRSWSKRQASAILSRSDDWHRRFLMKVLTRVIHRETQRDGYELRRLDFESRPLTKLPSRKIIETFVLEEETMRDRVIKSVCEDIYGLTPNSTQRADIRSVENVIGYIIAVITRCRVPKELNPVVPKAVSEFLANEPLQPKFGFAHALPRDTRDKLAIEWERLYQHDWQFGKAVFEPRTVEDRRGNLVWMRCEEEWQQRLRHMRDVETGEAVRQHKVLVDAASS